jgi:hypothetical protein
MKKAALGGSSGGMKKPARCGLCAGYSSAMKKIPDQSSQDFLAVLGLLSGPVWIVIGIALLLLGLLI